MDSVAVHTVLRDGIYKLDNTDTILVTGGEIIEGISKTRWYADTIQTIQPHVFYKLTEKDSVLWTGKKIIEILPKEEYQSVMGWGALGLGIVLGWNLYFINRYRKKESIQIGDIAAILAALAGVVILSFLGNSARLIGLYGIGLLIGFFSYFSFLVFLSIRTKDPNFKFPDFFLKIHDNQNPNREP